MEMGGGRNGGGSGGNASTQITDGMNTWIIPCVALFPSKYTAQSPIPTLPRKGADRSRWDREVFPSLAVFGQRGGGDTSKGMVREYTWLCLFHSIANREPSTNNYHSHGIRINTHTAQVYVAVLNAQQS